VLAGPAIAACGLAGVLAGLLTDSGAGDAFAASLALPALALVVERRPLRVGLALASVAMLAMAIGAVARTRALDPPVVRWLEAHAEPGDASEPVQVVGHLATDAERTGFGVRLLVDVEQIRDERAVRPAKGVVQAYVAGDRAASEYREWTAGRHVVAWASLREPALALNPGGPGARWQRLRRPFHLTGSVKSALMIEVDRGAWWHEAGAAIRTHVRRAVERHIAPHDRQSAAVVAAILIGDRVGLSPAVQDRLQRAGTYHVIAISGGNVALLTALCFFALRLLLRSPRIVSLVTMAVVLGYGGIVAGDPSVKRAVTAACVYLTLRVAGLVPRAVHVLATVALAVVLVEPLTAIHVGAWLSFGATAAIILCAGRIVRWVGFRRGPWAWRAAAMGVIALFAATLSAELALLPVQAAVFSRVGVAGLGLNFIAIPAMAFVEILGLLTVGFGGWAETVAAWCGHAAHVSARVLLGSATLVDYWPWLSWRVPPTALVWGALYYAGVGAALWPAAGRPHRRLGAAVAVVSAVVIVTAPALTLRAPAEGQLRLTMLDVGQGDALVVQTPSGHSMLVDAGGARGGFDIGGRVVTPALWSLGVRRLDWLLVTHADRDHIGGAVSVVRDLQPREVWEGIPVAGHEDLEDLRSATLDRGIAWRTVHAGHTLVLGDVHLVVEHPPAPDWERPRVRNDDSVVIRLRYRAVDVLLTGDAATEFEEGWAPGDRAPFRLLKVAHHGSRSSTGPALLRAYQPDVALVSAGRRNLFSHPSSEVIARLAQNGATVFRTDRDGAVIVETDGRGVTIRSIAGRTLVWRAGGGPS
jgi:competence protein ComEC